jgi:hypothetical protein
MILLIWFYYFQKHETFNKHKFLQNILSIFLHNREMKLFIYAAAANAKSFASNSAEH